MTWQAAAALVVAFIALSFAGWRGGVSALLGGLVNVVAAAAYVVFARAGSTDSPGAAVRTMLRAEAGKVMVIVVLLWLGLTAYRDIETLAFFSAFVVTVIASQTAILGRKP